MELNRTHVGDIFDVVEPLGITMSRCEIIQLPLAAFHIFPFFEELLLLLLYLKLEFKKLVSNSFLSGPCQTQSSSNVTQCTVVRFSGKAYELNCC